MSGDFKKFSMYNDNEETTASSGTTMSGEKTADKFLKSKTPIERWDDFIPRSARFITKVIEEYSDQQNAALRAALAELIQIAEHTLVNYTVWATDENEQKPVREFFKDKHIEGKAIVERAKRLISEEA